MVKIKYKVNKNWNQTSVYQNVTENMFLWKLADLKREDLTENQEKFYSLNGNEIFLFREMFSERSK